MSATCRRSLPRRTLYLTRPLRARLVLLAGALRCNVAGTKLIPICLADSPLRIEGFNTYRLYLLDVSRHLIGHTCACQPPHPCCRRSAPDPHGPPHCSPGTSAPSAPPLRGGASPLPALHAAASATLVLDSAFHFAARTTPSSTSPRLLPHRPAH
ncbi:hypothetical protein C8R46DRAFT_289452 [Mycena filopes]|nr:hypothetical protein C8R46DRAFT_289452 [Mycena filopes]